MRNPDRDTGSIGFPKDAGKFTHLEAGEIVKTMDRLERRIAERFPEAGLRRVAQELCGLARSTQHTVTRLQRPNWIIRISAFIAIGAILAVVVAIISLSLGLAPGADGWAEWIQAIESAINELIFLAIALFFLFSLEMRFKRRIALAHLHRLRSLAHVIDMHQLTKDPAYLLGNAQPTASSPERVMKPFELKRYLDYCTEMLSLISKLSALYAQHVNDAVVLAAVNDMESLADGLSVRIWQKIMILDLPLPESAKDAPGKK